MNFQFECKDIQSQICILLSVFYADEDWKDYLRAIRQVPRFHEGKSIHEDTAWMIWDSLGAYPARTEELDRLYHKAGLISARMRGVDYQDYRPPESHRARTT